eukprot:IDg6822t1
MRLRASLLLLLLVAAYDFSCVATTATLAATTARTSKKAASVTEPVSPRAWARCEALARVANAHASGLLALQQRRAKLSASMPPLVVLLAAAFHWCAGAPLVVYFYAVLAIGSIVALVFAVLAQLALPAPALSAQSEQQQDIQSCR